MAQRISVGDNKVMSKRNAETIIEEFKVAFRRFHGVEPTVVLYSAFGKWYDVSYPTLGNKVPDKVKLGELPGMTEKLRSRLLDREPKPVETLVSET